ncbi:unnamed protein product [Rhizoctonia solani]|uniref:Zinc-finger domain-containing protein n=1 Tax=Rhizoctonia solani TaxID=456999 RepID=A0A8H3BL13_9AGAM|nr:unnamed protein product [Rhizoctonia solani]
MTKRRTREDEDALLMPPPLAPTTATGLAPSIEGDSHPPSRYLAPTSPSRRFAVASGSGRPSFGRFNSTGPEGRNALDNIGYAPENIPTPRTTRPFSAVGGTRKRQKGLKLLPTTSTSPILPKSSLPTIEPSDRPSASTKHDEKDDHEYIVDSSDDEGPVPFNLHPKDVLRSPKMARNQSAHLGKDRTATRLGPTASSSRIPLGTTLARRKTIGSRFGITPARVVTTSTLPATTSARLSNPVGFIDPTPIPLNLAPTTQTPRQVKSPFLPEVTPSGSRPRSLVSSTSHSVRTASQPSVRRLDPRRLARSDLAISPTRAVPPIGEASAGTKRRPVSKSTSPPTDPKRPRISLPSPPAVEDIIVVSSSDDDEPCANPGETSAGGLKGRDEGEWETEETEREVRPPSPSPSLGEYRPAPSGSRLRPRSASSDIVLIGSRPHSTTGRKSNEEVPLDSCKEVSRQSPREVAAEPTAPAPPEEVLIPFVHPKGASPTTPRSHRSSSSEQPQIYRKRATRRAQSSKSPRFVAGETGTGRRIRRRIRMPELSPSPRETGTSLSSQKQGDEASPHPVEPAPERIERATLSPKKSSPLVELGSPSPSPPWTGKPLFRPPTTSISSLTTSSKDRRPRDLPPQTTVGWSQLGETEPAPSRDAELPPPRDSAQPFEPSNNEPAETPGEDPLQSMYDEPTHRPPQYQVAGPSHEAPVSPERTSRRSMAPSYSNLSLISSMPPPTLSSIALARPPIVSRLRMECVLLPRASKATRRALERFKRKDKGKGKDPSEYPSQQPSASASQAEDPSTPDSSPQAPRVKYLVIDPQLALPSYYESLPPEIEESSERYCHCCRTRSVAGTIKMRCRSMTRRRKKGIPHGEAHECGLYWCQRCIAKHDIPFNPLGNFRCPLCTGTCDCDVCRRERGQEPLGRRAVKIVKVKPGKRSLDAFVKGRVTSGSGSRTSNPSNPTVTPSESIAEIADSAIPLTMPPESTSSPSNPNADSTTSARRASDPGSLSKPTPTTWYGRRPPPPLRHRRVSEGHILSTETDIFIPRGPRKSEFMVDTSLEQVDESLEYSEEPESEEDEPADENEPVTEDRLQAFEGDYSAAGDVSLLDADSGAFELGIDDRLDDSAHDMGDARGTNELGGLSVASGSIDIVVENSTIDPGVVENLGDSTVEGGFSTTHTPAIPPSPTSTEVPIGTLAYPPSDSDGSQAGAHTPVPPAPEDIISTSAGTLDAATPLGILEYAPTAGILDEIPVAVIHDSLADIFNETIQGVAESDTTTLAHDYGSASLGQQTSETDEVPSTSEADEPRLKTPDLDLTQAEFVRDSTAEPELNLELNPGLGQLHPEGTFASVPCISRGDGGDYTIYGSLQDIPLFNAAMDCSDDTHGIALSSQSEPGRSICGPLSECHTQPQSVPFSPHQPEIERLSIFELEGFESEFEHEPDLALATDPESAKSTILETPSPPLEPDMRSNLADIQNLFNTTNELRTGSFILANEEKHIRDQMGKIVRSRFTQNVDPNARSTRSQTKKSTIERGKFLRSKRCYGAIS